MRRDSRSVLPGFGLSLGITCTYLGLLVLLVAHCEHGVAQGATQAGHVDAALGRRLVEVGGVEDDEVGHVKPCDQSLLLTRLKPSAVEACALGMALPVTGVTGNTALIWPVPLAPK